MKRRNILLSAAALGACSQIPQPFNTKQSPTPAPFDAEGYDVLNVTDVSRTDLGGVVIYDEVIAFDGGTFTAPTAANPTGTGGRIKGAVQSRVVRSDTTKTLIFSIRFRDMQFQPATGPAKKGSQLVFVELVTLFGFPKSAYPVELYALSTKQSLGAQTLPGFSRGGGSFEWNTFLTEPDGSTFFSILTKATQFKTGKFLSLEVDTRANNGTTTTIDLDKIAIPA